MSPEERSDRIKLFARELGFDACGIALACRLSDQESSYREWLGKHYHAGMYYLERNLDKRFDPCLLVEGAVSVIVVLQNYYPAYEMPSSSAYLVSRYAYGDDYHHVIRGKLKSMLHRINQEISPTTGRAFTDSAPVLERAWAVKAGLGWIGKNSMLITPRSGSYFFIGELITDLELAPDPPYGGTYCGDCTRCIKACPTGAIVDERTIDANKCISYLTIENKGEIPPDLKNQYRQWIFGCDICQLVCPWNCFSHPHIEKMLEANTKMMGLSKADWENMDEKTFHTIFARSAIKRAKYDGLMRNIRFLSAQT